MFCCNVILLTKNVYWVTHFCFATIWSYCTIHFVLLQCDPIALYMYIQGDGNLCSTWSYVISFCSAAHETVKFALNSISPSVFLMVISPPRLRQLVRVMPLLVVLLSLLMKLQFINKQKKKVVFNLIVLKLLFFCSNFMLLIYRVFIQIVCVCVFACASHIQGLSFKLCVCVGVCAFHTQGLSFRLCVCV